VLEPLGYEYEVDLSETDQARCAVTVRSIQKKRTEVRLEFRRRRGRRGR
jgi:hypothetical protein